MSAGALVENIRFESPFEQADGYGGRTNGFVHQFTCRGRYTRMRGGEAVMAGRLEGKQSTVIRVRAAGKTREVTTDWRAVDDRTGEIFNIRSQILSDDRQWIDFTAESGLAT